MAHPIQAHIVHERPAPHRNEGANLAAGKITVLALSIIATLVSFVVLPFEGAFVATLGCIALFSLLSLSGEQPRNDENTRPVRWYQFINPAHYFPRWSPWRNRPVVHFANTIPTHRLHRPHPQFSTGLRREAARFNQDSRVPVGERGSRRTPHPSAFAPPSREGSLLGEYAPYPMPNTQNASLSHGPSGSVAGIPVRQPGDRVAVGGARPSYHFSAPIPPQTRSTHPSIPPAPAFHNPQQPSRVGVGSRRH